MSNKYLLLGKDQGLKNDKLDELKKAFKKENGQVNAQKFYLNDKNDVKNFLEGLSSASLFSNENTFYILENAESFKESDVRIFASSSENSNDYFTFLSSENKVSASLEKCFQKQNIFIFYEMFENQKVPFLKTEAAKRGLKLNDDAALLLLSLKDNDTLTLRKTLDEISLFIDTEKKEKLITSELLYEFLNHDREENGFTIASYIARKDKSSALLAIKSIVNENANALSSLFPSLLFSLFRVEEAAINKENGAYKDAIFSISDSNGNTTLIRSPLEKNTINTFLKNYNRKEISKIVKTVIETESAIRQNDTILADILLTKMIVDL